MGKSRKPSHIALFNSSYIILFDDGPWTNSGVSQILTNTMKQSGCNIQFLTLGPHDQWFFRRNNGQISYSVYDDDLGNQLKNSRTRPYKVWFSGNYGYILQNKNLTLSWKNIPNNLRNELIGRKKFLPKVNHIAFGPDDTWWVSYHDGSSCWSANLSTHIGKYLMESKYLVLDLINHQNFFTIKNNGDMTWLVNNNCFNDYICNLDQSDNVVYMNPQCIRYTQSSIKPHFSDGQCIRELQQELEYGMTTPDEIPMIDVIQTRSGNIWSLNNRRLWCFRQAHNIDQIPVRIVNQRPSWFNNRISKLKNPFHVHIRGSLDEVEFHSDYSDSDDYF